MSTTVGSGAPIDPRANTRARLEAANREMDRARVEHPTKRAPFQVLPNRTDSGYGLAIKTALGGGAAAAALAGSASLLKQRSLAPALAVGAFFAGTAAIIGASLAGLETVGGMADGKLPPLTDEAPHPSVAKLQEEVVGLKDALELDTIKEATAAIVEQYDHDGNGVIDLGRSEAAHDETVVAKSWSGPVRSADERGYSSAALLAGLDRDHDDRVTTEEMAEHVSSFDTDRNGFVDRPHQLTSEWRDKSQNFAHYRDVR